MVKDIAKVIGSDLGQSMGSYLQRMLDSGLVLGIFSLIILDSYLSGLGCMIVNSRLVYAYSRDGAIPGSAIWSIVNPLTRTPVYADIIPDRLK